ncbi:MAG: hypothetical protein AB1716_00025 [Planctomycetota bacterium]
MSQLSRARLAKAITEKQLGAAQAEAEQVCPAHVTHTVTVRLRGQAQPAGRCAAPRAAG